MFDPSADLPAVVDGLEPITLRRHGVVLSTIARAWRGPVTDRETTASGGRVVASDVHWHLPVSECRTAPALGDVLLDRNENRWTVLSVAGSALLGRWDCTCRDLEVAHGLNDVITVQRAVYTKDPEGAASEHWHTWRSGVRARIQPLAVQVSADAENLHTTRRYRVFMVDDLEVDHTCRIVAADGSTYRIVASTGAEQIGALQTIDVERTT